MDEIQEKNNQALIKKCEDIIGSESTDGAILGFNIINLLDDIAKETDKIEILEYILTHYGDVDIKKTGKKLKGSTLTDEEWEQSVEKNSEYISAVINRLIYDRPTPSDFANGVLKLLNEFENRTDKIVAIPLILRKSIIPYVQIPSGGQFVTDKRYAVLLKKLTTEFKLLRAIQNSNLKNQSQMASLMLGVINSASTDEEKAVLMTITLALEYNRGREEAGD